MSKITPLYTRGSYKGIRAQQNSLAFDIIKNFLIETKPANVLELGTGMGALSLLINDVHIFNKFVTVDKTRFPSHNILIENGVTPIYQTINDPSFIEYAQNFIKSDGVTIVFCDNGKKIKEVNTFSNFLKTGDFILAHDYAYSKEVFNSYIKGNIWGSCEITDADIKESCERNSLVPFNESMFNSVAWTCRKKVVNG
jgi:cephalosporin hydroxylase